MVDLILTVGSNPLPVVVSARALKASRVFLLGTEAVRELADRAAKHLGESGVDGERTRGCAPVSVHLLRPASRGPLVPQR